MTNANAEMTERYAEDGFELPETWEGRMEAIIAGAVDYDDTPELIHRCADIADKAVREATPIFAVDRFPVDRGVGTDDVIIRCCGGLPFWFVLADYIIDALHRSPGEPPSENIVEDLLSMGRVADAVEQRQRSV